jgi:peptidoglycan hydrolase-like protein with peptidoglycan-binding domain
MALQSHLFRGDIALNACAAEDSAHVKEGAKGDAVAKIQAALIDLDNAQIADQELSNKLYGQSTAAAVLAYKKKRNIVNQAYQTQPDNIVGKMTIKALDLELIGKQQTVVPRHNKVCRRLAKTVTS